jgi:hypothetical protein
MDALLTIDDTPRAIDRPTDRSQNTSTAMGVAYLRFVHHLAVDGGYSLSIVGLSCAVPFGTRLR